MGNICRSPMAERLLRLAARERVGDKADTVLLSHSAGTGGWHAGEAMNPPAARELLRRGGDDRGFAARRLLGEHVDAADLVLTATAEQVDFVVGLRPDAAARHARGVALVEAAHAARAGRSPEPRDELDDPWGRGDSVFSRVAGEIDAVVRPFAAVLLEADLLRRSPRGT